jgi:hypothetical protein
MVHCKLLKIGIQIEKYLKLHEGKVKDGTSFRFGGRGRPGPKKIGEGSFSKKYFK